MASQKLAMASPETVMIRSTWSRAELRSSAEITPSGMPIRAETNTATKVNSRVAGSRLAKSSEIGRSV